MEDRICLNMRGARCLDALHCSGSQQIVDGICLILHCGLTRKRLVGLLWKDALLLYSLSCSFGLIHLRGSKSRGSKRVRQNSATSDMSAGPPEETQRNSSSKTKQKPHQHKHSPETYTLLLGTDDVRVATILSQPRCFLLSGARLG